MMWISMSGTNDSAGYFSSCTPPYTFSNPFMGGVYVTIGIITTIFYLPCLYVMTRRPLIENGCFKMMVALGLCDLWNIAITCFLDGIFSLFGISYCHHKMLFAITGTSGAAMWQVYMMLCITLAVSRALTFYSSHYSMALFKGGRVYWWILAAFAVGAAFFTTCMLSDSYYIYHAGKAIHRWSANSKLTKLAAYVDLAGSSVLIVPYAFVLLMLRQQRQKLSVASVESAEVNSLERRVMLQSFLICSFAAVVNLTYLSAEEFASDMWRTFHLCWIMAHGVNCLIYLTLNATIRSGVLALVGITAIIRRRGGCVWADAKKRKGSAENTTTSNVAIDAPNADEGARTPLSPRRKAIANYNSAEQTATIQGF